MREDLVKDASRGDRGPLPGAGGAEKTFKEKPILFSSDMVRAILEGRKNVTRRVMKPQIPDLPSMNPAGYSEIIQEHQRVYPCPYGKVGDRLWVRETWDEGCMGSILYRADYSTEELAAGKQVFKWRPSIFMPRWASRILLEITNIRSQRLDEIEEIDARIEGFKYDPPVTARTAFITLWDQLNEKRGFGFRTNPWVWVIGLKVVEVKGENAR